MLIGGDCRLDLVLGFDDSQQKILTQTMVSHEAIFRNQVLELHRLYKMQKMLMKDLDLNICSSSYDHIAPRVSAKTNYDFIYDDKVSPIADADTWQKNSGRIDKIVPPETISLEGSTSHEGLVEQNMSAKRKLFTCYELDLNKPLPEDESDPSSGVYEYDPMNNRSAETSAFDQQNKTNSTLTNETDNNCQKISTPEKNAKKNKENKLSSRELLEGTDSNRSPMSCKSDCITDDVSSNTKKVQSGNFTSNSNIDITVRKGAVSLLYFSSECLARNQENVSESKKRKESGNSEKDVPQSSSESYESIVLKQRECSPDEYCVSSAQCEISSSDKKDYGVKLKRGRRMKDFQKEILPELASLSRHEICEDVKIMELAIRSREYKKYRSKMGGKSESFSSVRSSRRSRLSYVGRRYYS